MPSHAYIIMQKWKNNSIHYIPDVSRINYLYHLPNSASYLHHNLYFQIAAIQMIMLGWAPTVWFYKKKLCLPYEGLWSKLQAELGKLYIKLILVAFRM